MSSYKHLALFALLVASGIDSSIMAQQTPPAAPSLADRLQIDRYKVNQQRARDLTADLLSILVDRQIQQLEDNRLTDLPLYDDLKSMRGRMGELAAQKMPDVIQLLVNADIAKPSERQEIMTQVHGRMRDILRDLLRERERLRLRRQQAELIERIGEIVLQQQATLDNTLTLSTAQEQLVLSTIDSQKNVSVLVDAFDETAFKDGLLRPDRCVMAYCRAFAATRKDMTAEAGTQSSPLFEELRERDSSVFLEFS